MYIIAQLSSLNCLSVIFCLISSDCLSWSAHKACLRSHCGKISIRRGAQKNLYIIRGTMEHHEGHHHHPVEETEQHDDVTKNRTTLKYWGKEKKRWRRLLRDLQWHCSSCRNIWKTLLTSCLYSLCMAYVISEVPSHKKKNHPKPWILQTMRQNVFRSEETEEEPFIQNSNRCVSTKSTTAMVKHAGGSIMPGFCSSSAGTRALIRTEETGDRFKS